MGEIHLCFQGLRNFFMSGEFLAVIKSNSMNRITSQQINNALFDGFFGPLFHQAHAQEPAFSIDQRHNGPFHPFANDGVRFPVANTLSSIYDGWTLLYGSLTGYFASIVAVCTSFSILFLPSEMAVQLTAIPFVFPNVLVDSFGTDLNAKMFQNPLSGLFGAEILSQVSLNNKPVSRGDPSFGFPLSPLCPSLSLFITIASFSSVSVQFSADRRFIDADDFGYLCLGDTVSYSHI